jgi:phage-related protein
MKDIAFLGGTLEDLRSFPPLAMREAGYQLDRVQNGLAPADFKSIPSVGKAVMELRIWDEADTFRVM